VVDYSTFDDEALIQLIIHARQDALSELYDRYSRLVFSLALHVVGDRATAEEVTMDVFTRVWEKARTYRSDQAKVSTWLSRIARNRSIDVLRRRGARPEQASVSWAEISPSAHPQANGPEEITVQKLQRQRVRVAIGQLPAEQRQVLAMAYFSGNTQREIAQVLDLPLGTVKTRIRLAMNKLRSILVDEMAG
jgi:RNA polymerase sigma-70 factor (ECF subfamily)